MQRSARATIKDVAKAAGVSPTTVSHALNGKGVVRRETAERIRRVAAEVGYRASPIAQGLQNSKLGLLALVIRPLHSLDTFLPEGVDYFLRLAGAASLAAMERGYSLMLVDDPTKPDAPLSATAADAYIVSEPFADDPVLTLLSEKRIPFVSIGSDPSRPGRFVELETHDWAEAVLVLDHLVAAGAQRVALLTGSDANSWNRESEDAYRHWCAERGQDPDIAAFPEAEGERVGDAALDRFFGPSATAPPDALFCLTGRHAAGVNSAAAARGIRVPEDLLLAAGSGALQNRISHPGVTTLDLRPEASAQRAVEVAVRLAEGLPLDLPLEVERAVLDVRGSTTRG
ncbi:LacI family transcriptional regulator [Leucobacter allii]|uniref:LacI family transcriptional regulator n=1 Tax=Leucobacter allii TaxID=2932247 RepID=A0ABY4FK15_9MICO|nr:LacI family DNA-binding transcriptional regulator [Leucobacter allii]UOQ56568.1 LacI family transcriptional regulator [Leucobacter allii]UOR01002.1 LacI family transcriptional regulator [Leucobacter allii]